MAGHPRREKEFAIYLSGDDILHVRIVKDGGTPVEFCVSYELLVMGVSYQPCRIDDSHNEGIHLDAFDVRGVRIRRVSLPYVVPREMVPDSLRQMKEFIKHHRERFLRELAGGR